MKELRNVSSSWSKLDLYSLVYPVITSLCTYPGHLDRKAQVRGEEWRHEVGEGHDGRIRKCAFL